MSQNMGRALRQFTFGKGKSAGRNSSGCITIFHRGGGAKRLGRKIDMKRNTSSIGIVERIEYDPNRTSKIALVRWTEGVQPDRQMKCNTTEEFVPSCKILEPITTTIRGTFSLSLSSLSGKVDQRKLACFSPGLMASYVVVGQPTRMPHLSKNPFTSESGESKKTSVKEVLLSALSSQKDKAKSAIVFPRIAVAGAKPAFCARGKGDELGGKNSFSLSEVKKWKPDSILWAHRIKRKAALSWGGI